MAISYGQKMKGFDIFGNKPKISVSNMLGYNPKISVAKPQPLPNVNVAPSFSFGGGKSSGLVGASGSFEKSLTPPTIAKTMNTPAIDFSTNAGKVNMTGGTTPETSQIQAQPPTPMGGARVEVSPVWLSDGVESPDYEYRTTYDKDGNVIGTEQVKKAGAGTTGTSNGLTAPTQLTELPDNERLKLEALKQAEIEQLNREYALKEKTQLGASASFLAKTGSLGRTVTGAPVESGLGLSSTIQKQVKDELAQKIAQTNAKYAGLEYDKLSELNTVAQQNFQNAFALAEANKKAEPSYQTVGAGQTIIDPTTGRVIYQAPESTTGKGYETLSPGQTLYDTMTGEAIFTAPEKPSDESKPITEKIGEDLYQWNKETQTWDKAIAGQAKTEISPYQAEHTARTIQSVDELKILADKDPGIFGATADIKIPDAMRSRAFINFRSQLDTLKSNIAFSELTAMREASKTGGALGQVSDKENQLLTSALGALSMSQDYETFKGQLDKIKASIDRWQKANQQYGGTTSGGGLESMDWENLDIKNF